MLEDETNPQPQTSWTWEQWRKASGRGNKVTNVEVINTAASEGISPANYPWEPPRFWEWIKQRLDRDKALQVIAVLRIIAAKNHVKLFTNDLIIEHSRIFLRSQVCREVYGEPNANELWEICQPRLTGMDEQQIEIDELADLRGLVHPRPPNRLFGRENDRKRLINAIDNNLVTVIDATAGDGKTALAWNVAAELWGLGRFTKFDWTTDKRYVVDVYGNEIKLDHPELDFEGILRSMVKRFRWSSILGKEGDRLVAGCADLLRKGHYLLIVDNLETMPDSEIVVRRLLDMLVPSQPHAIQSSRAVITSRKKVDTIDCGEVPIEGIEVDQRENFIEHLERIWQTAHPLSQQEKHTLADLTGGSPLLLQIAVRYFVVSPNNETFDQIVSTFDNGRHKAFPNLFGSLLQQLASTNHQSHQLALIAARESIVSHDAYVDREELLDVFRIHNSAIENNEQILSQFIEALGLLLKYRVLSPVDSTRYLMHPLIRSYLYSLLEDDHEHSSS